ncbi:MAG TPA: secondary thiamine-phosphate synthase enzyme YjbQ [Sphingomicrobium sp.]|nr:secondary thiamine-phosphate synthase enzyme YjbQ [Sphingomicrobium sp.]
MLVQASALLTVRAPRQGLHPITGEISGWLGKQAITSGLLTILCRHTSASLLIQENAAQSARRDLEAYFARIAPEGAGYAHNDEGPDDMPAHLRAALTQATLSLPVGGGQLLLGRWQGIYLFEHRREPTQRELALHLAGE